MNDAEDHFRKLERMYLCAPTNQELYNGVTIAVSSESCELTLPVNPKFFHAAGAIHGSVYFKMLDDAAFFAVNSIVKEVFVYTVSFNIQFLRPVTKGTLRATGEVKSRSASVFIADSILFNEAGKVVGRGSGHFMKSKIVLNETIGYK